MHSHQLIFVLASCLFTAHSTWAKSDSLTTVQQQAQQLNLANQPQWQTLLHYQYNHSLVTDKNFFFHPNGASDSQAELNATLAAFFQTATDDDNSLQCLFPARFTWLQQQLNLTKYLPEPRCEKLHNWLTNLAATGISLVFPVAYLNNPASMFGHSFLRLDKKSEPENDLMAWTINYAAVTHQEHGVKFALKGLFGGYDGEFSLAPYYLLVKEYADLESRDLWEYQLNFSAAEQQMLLKHLWEIQHRHFAYYFINKNCGYQLLSLLEVARPSLHLTEQFNWDAIPADTVRAVTALPDLLKQVHYRPALATQLTAKANLLSEAAQQLAKDLAQSDILVNAKSITALEPEPQAQVLELAFAYLSYLNGAKIKRNETIDGNRAYQLLTARSQLPVLSSKTIIPTPAFRPDQGHAGNRAQLLYGYDGVAHYIGLAYRWSYHDFYDPSAGFATGSQVEFFKPSFRYYPQQAKFSFESLELFNLNSMPARNSFISPFSWQATLAVNRQRFSDQQRELVGMAKVGGGVSYQLADASLFSTSALATLMIGDKFQQNLAVGLGGVIHVQHDFSPDWRVGIDAQIIQYLQGISYTSYSIGLKQRLTISNNQTLVLELKRSNEFSQAEFNAQLAWQFYF